MRVLYDKVEQNGKFSEGKVLMMILNKVDENYCFVRVNAQLIKITTGEEIYKE